MKKGGCLIIDLKNEDLTSSVTIDGIYDLIEGNYRKPILLSGINLGGVEKADVYTMPTLSGTSFVFQNIYGYDVTITEDDAISVVTTDIATTSGVTELIEGGTLDNAKPIYIHPVVCTSVSNDIGFSVFIFDNSPEPYNSWAKLTAKMISVANSIRGTARFPVMGSALADSHELIGRNIDATTENKIIFYGRYSGESGVSYSLNITDFTGWSLYDGVNKIN